jgi:hypothetical protein
LQQRIEQFDRAKEAKFLSMSDEPTLLQKGIVLVMVAIFEYLLTREASDN